MEGYETGVMVRADDLREALLAVRGVASAQVTENNGGTPHVRVVLDGTRPDDEVSAEISRVLDETGLRTSGVVHAEPTSVAPLETPETDDRDLHVVPTPGTVASVSVEESSDGVSVRVVTDAGDETVERVGAGTRGMDRAIVTGVARIYAMATPQIIAIEERDIGGDAVILMVIEGDDGRRAAGASVVSGGRPFAVARAAHAAVVDLR